MKRAVADYESRCSVCDGPISEGDAIALLEDDDEWIHLECREELGE